jgi:hypothetical protein
MARWTISREHGVVKLFYDNLVQGTRYDCGFLDSSADDDEVVAWIFNQGQPILGDQIVLSDGSFFFFNKAPGKIYA